MIYLDTPQRALQAVLAGAIATTQPVVTVFFYDHTPQATTTLNRGGTVITALNSTTDVTILAAPALQGIIRNIHTIFINNRDTATVVVTVKIDDGGTDSPGVTQSIATGESLVYEDKSGWQILSPITPPFTDTTPIVRGSADGTKLVRIEADGLTTATTRVITMPDFDVTLLAGAATQAQQEAGSSLTTITTPGRQQYHPSASKFWLEWDAAGNIVVSYNMTSVTDNAVGDWTLNIATDMSGAAMAVVAWPVQTGAGGILVCSGFGAGTVGVNGYVAFATGTLNDLVNPYFAIGFGDQA